MEEPHPILNGASSAVRWPRWCPRAGAAPSRAAGRAWPRRSGSGLAAAASPVGSSHGRGPGGAGRAPTAARRAASGAGQLSVGHVGFGAAGAQDSDHDPVSSAPRTSMDYQHPVGQGSSGVARCWPGHPAPAARRREEARRHRADQPTGFAAVAGVIGKVAAPTKPRAPGGTSCLLLVSACGPPVVRCVAPCAVRPCGIRTCVPPSVGVWVRTDLGPSRDPSAARPPRRSPARSRPGPAG